MGIFTSLNKSQREAVGLLQTGTFLEYFDLMLYVHMALLLNQLFFPETDRKTTALLYAFAFCSTYVMRPVGAFFFGYIGDSIGRKTTVIITMMMMATSCIIMATLPTYAQIGITAAWFVTFCRVIQGISSMGEIIGAEIYLTELIKPPARYPIVGLIGCASRFGTMVALGVATLATSYDFNWRYAFWAGAVVAIIGSVARTRLRETPDFVDMKRRMKRTLDESEEQFQSKAEKMKAFKKLIKQEKIDWKIPLGYFFIASGSPVCLYFSYIYCGNLLKEVGYTSAEIIYQNFFVSGAEFIVMLFTTFLSYKIHPLKIIKVKAFLFLSFLCIVPLALGVTHTPFSIFMVQLISGCLALIAIPATAVIMAHFPVYKRFTNVSFTYALSRAVMSIVISFGLVYLTDFFGYWGLCFIMVPVTMGFLWGVVYFEKLEKTSVPMEVPLETSLLRPYKKYT